MKISRPRTYMELRVGDSAVLPVILLVQQADLHWFNGDDNDKNDGTDESSSDTCRWPEFCQVLQEQVLPRILQESIEDAHYQDPNSALVDRSIQRPPSTIVQGGIALGEASDKARTNNKNGKRPRKMTKKQLKLLEQQEKQANADSASAMRASQRPHLWAMGPSLQLAYKCERATEPTATLVFPESEDPGDQSTKSTSTSLRLHSLEHLPFTLTVACGPRRKQDPQQEDGLLLLQPELIPMAHLFRPPKDVQDDDGDDPVVVDETKQSTGSRKPKKKRARSKEVIELDD